MSTKIISLTQAQSIAQGILEKVTARGYAVASDLGDLAVKDTIEKTDLSTELAEELDAKLDAADLDVVEYVIKAEGTPDSGASATYQLYTVGTGTNGEDEVVTGSAKINIPLDMVVSDGSVVDITFDSTEAKLYEGVTDVTTAIMGTGTASAVNAGKYVKLTIANATQDTLYIAVNDLVDNYGAGNGISITNNTITVVVDSSNANGLSVTSNGIALATATTTTAGAMSASDKAKLDDADVTAYTAGNGIDITNHEVSANVSAGNGLSVGASGIAMAVVTASTSGVGGTNGAMTATDKEKLDNADVTAYTGTGAIDVTNHVISVGAATASTSGVGGSAGTMSAADKEKLDSIAFAETSDITALVNGLDSTP